jgi:deoxyribodipyrimidine photo-lyase
VPDRYLAEPWTMPDDVQAECGCRIGRDYPEPIVEHSEARRAALERYRV